jgi:hypothetical protein
MNDDAIATALRRERAYSRIINGPRARLWEAKQGDDEIELAKAQAAYWQAYSRAMTAYRKTA